jgi:hypothetical protein
MFTSSLPYGAKEEVAVAREFPVREEPLRELLLKKSHQIPQPLSPLPGPMDGVQDIMIRRVRIDQVVFFLNLSSQPSSRHKCQIEELRGVTFFRPKKSTGL